MAIILHIQTVCTDLTYKRSLGTPWDTLLCQVYLKIPNTRERLSTNTCNAWTTPRPSQRPIKPPTWKEDFVVNLIFSRFHRDTLSYPAISPPLEKWWHQFWQSPSWRLAPFGRTRCRCRWPGPSPLISDAFHCEPFDMAGLQKCFPGLICFAINTKMANQQNYDKPS